MGKLINRQKHHSSEDNTNKNDEVVEDIDVLDEDEDIDEIADDDETDTDENSGENRSQKEDVGNKAGVKNKINENVSENDAADPEADLRRIYRRKRRIRNQIIAYGIVVIFAVVLVMTGISIQRGISNLIKEKRNEKQQEEQLAEVDLPEPTQTEPVIETPPEIEQEDGLEEEEAVDEEFEEFINSCILAMPLEDKVAGLFVVTPEALTGVRTVVRAGEGTQDALGRYAVGGLVYFSQNILNEEQLKEMLSNTVTMSKYPIFLAVDEEGGSVSRLKESGIAVTDVGDMAVIGAGGDADKAYEAGVAISTYMNRIGFNLDFAPVADIAESGNEALGSRSFGTDPELTADMVSNVVKGLEGNGISACLKHFPGIGSSTEDTHNGRVEITKTLEEMRDSDFVPFKAGIDAGVNLVMVSHVTASDLDIDGLPSSLSRTVITDVLREELGYDGIVITDALNMSAISEYYTSQEAAVRAIRAGADMLLMPEDFEAAYKGVLAAVQDGTILEERIDESLRRIYRIKYADKLQ